MNDPHVKGLYYRFVSEDPTDRFEEAQPLTLTLRSFNIDLREGLLVATPEAHYANEEQAKAAFEPILRSWESSVFLCPSRFRIRFKFEQAEVIDRNPTPGVLTLHAKVGEFTVTLGTATSTRNLKKYPEPDGNFAASSLTDELIYRLQQYKDGRQTLPLVAYYILERLEKEFVRGKAKKPRRELGRILNIESKVLDQTGKFSNRPEARIGRHASGQYAPLTALELNWLEEAVFCLVRRTGEVNAGPESLPIIQMTDLPQL